ncbi:MAG TPA: c-type cytochrome [Vicinamibacteria bacterium]|nr:c-type cytochrome [Vicinamibacteria bacterium]
MSPMRLGYAISFAFLLESVAFTCQAYAQTAGATTPDVIEGERFYRAHCRICHGRAGMGDRGPALDRGEFDRATTDDELDEILFNGIPGTGMPGVVDSQRKRRQVIAYLRSLGVRDREPPPGNPASGEAMFRGDGGCLACHMVNGEGSPLGPELSAIGRARAAASLRRSLLDPDADVEKRYWSARLTFRAGGSLSGTLIDEDTFSVRLMDPEGNLHAFLKSELESLQLDRGSTMTSYEDVFSASQIDDLVAYLSSLKGRK